MNKVRYSIVWMGPINTDWIRENGDHWCAGRIEAHRGTETIEYRMPVVTGRSWARFREWLWDLKTNKVLSRQELIERFLKETGHKMEWFAGEDT